MSDGDTPIIRTSQEERRGVAERSETGLVVANRLLTAINGMPLAQFRMNYAISLELGCDHEVTIGTPGEGVMLSCVHSSVPGAALQFG